MKNLLATLALTFVAVSGTVNAQDWRYTDIPEDDVELGLPAYGGNGCPQGTASAVISPDKKSLSILFDSFLAQAGGGSGVTVDRKSCNIAIPVKVPQGYSLTVFAVDYRGFNSLPRGAMARFSAEYFFAGVRGPIASQTWRGPVDSDYTFTNNLAVEALVWSACGQDVNLRINSSMMLTNRDFNIDALSTVDSLDLQSGLVYHVQWKRCR